MVRRLLLLNGVATICAVCHHSVDWILTAKFWWTDRYRAVTIPNYDWVGTWDFYGLRLADQLWSAAVPVFLFISGYFAAAAAGRSRGALPWSVVTSRIKRLVPPYLLWSGVALILAVAQGQEIPPGAAIVKLLTGGAAGPYYYVPLVLSLYVLAPGLTVAARRYPTSLLLSAGFVQLLVVAVRSYAIAGSRGSASLPMPLGAVINSHLGAYSFWFVLGLVSSLHLAGLKARLQRHPALLRLGVAILMGAALLEWDLLRQSGGRAWLASGVTLGDNLLALAALLACLAPDDARFPRYAWLERLGEQSYGVYLIHIFALEAAARGAYHLAPPLLGYTAPLVLVLVALGVAVPVALMKAVKASPLARYYVYAFG